MRNASFFANAPMTIQMNQGKASRYCTNSDNGEPSVPRQAAKKIVKNLLTVLSRFAKVEER
jgi:hypothetical protein